MEPIKHGLTIDRKPESAFRCVVCDQKTYVFAADPKPLVITGREFRGKERPSQFVASRADELGLQLT